MDQENVPPARTSFLRPPSKVSLSSMPYDRDTYDATEPDTNSRSILGASSGNALKHRPTGLPEPAAKRKTLAERAGEPTYNESGALQSSLPVSAAIKATSLAGSRYASTSSNGSSNYVPSSYSSRHSSSTSINGRGHNGRPQSAFSHSRSKSSATAGRPATAFENSISDDRNSAFKKRQGTSQVSPLLVKRQRRRNNRTDNIYPKDITSCSSSVAAPRRLHFFPPNPFRDVSLSTCMQKLSLGKPSGTIQWPRQMSGEALATPATPCYIPKLIQPSPMLESASPLSHKKHFLPSPQRPGFLSKDSNTRAAWDTKGRLEDVEELYTTLRSQMESTTKESSTLQEHVQLYKTRISELEDIRAQLTTKTLRQQNELEDAKVKLNTAAEELEIQKRSQAMDVDELKRQHRRDVEDERDRHRRDGERARRDAQDDLDRLHKTHRDELADQERKLKSEVEEEREKRVREVQEISAQWAAQRQNAEVESSGRDREKEALQGQIAQAKAETEQERAINESLRSKLTGAAATAAELESTIEGLRAKASFLESDSQAQSQAFADLRQKTQEAIDSAEQVHAKLRAEETLRRKLHNQVQELKGNIRVFCRVRPTLEAESDETAKMGFPDTDEDSKELLVQGPDTKSALGKVTQSKNNFSFDRVFAPASSNEEIFEEISQLVQSALDGYNVCIFCYGQTGSGKTYTMSSENGMIPLAVHQIYSTAASLKEKGWDYSMEGSFVEVYNEALNDLLGKAEDIDKKKLQIVHEGTRTNITDVTTESLESSDTVTHLLRRAASNRSVAATKANSRSSRSHSVFILKLIGENRITGERSEGTLNLVDLAGSERLAHSQAEGDRLKETQSINKSLSCLGDVIAALGQGKEGTHIPYRNSKLTYLLQNSLGGNSKTLMFVMISPLQEHLSETLTSLKFATKVHNTHIGTAKKQTRVRD